MNAAAIRDLELVTIEEAARLVGKTPHNIRDYIQRGRIAKYNVKGERIERASNGELRVSLTELRRFLELVQQGLAKHHYAGLHPELGFYDVSESERTKHVHRLHPYLGKFIPQLVEWFFARYFKPGDVILDPFMGSGTTLVQGNEMGMHTVGIDISPFNCLIARVKVAKYSIAEATAEITDIERRVATFSTKSFGTPATRETLSLFDDSFESLAASLLNGCTSQYLREWFAPRALVEILYYKHLIGEYRYRELLQVILSRSVRSSRLVPHYDLATPKKPLPVGQPYWCRKHQRYCTPIDNCIEKIHIYSRDTARRIAEFDLLRSDCVAIVLEGDSRTLDLRASLADTPLAGRQFDGIFTSPPYVGQIDYHEQHRYAYELFGFPRRDEHEIGPKYRGKSQQAQREYIEGIVAVLRNVLPLVKEDGNIFIVAHDRFGLYPEIARRSKLRILDRFDRAVTKRTEQGDAPYQETIFFMRKE